MTDKDHLKEFEKQARAFREGKRKKCPDLLAKPLFTVRSKNQRYLEKVDEDLEWQWKLYFLTYDIDPNKPSSWEMLARAACPRHCKGLTTTDKLPKGRRDAQKKRHFEFIVDLCYAWEDAIERCAKENNRPIEEVMDKEAVGYLDPEFRKRWRKTDDTLKKDYSKAKAIWAEVKKGERLWIWD